MRLAYFIYLVIPIFKKLFFPLTSVWKSFTCYLPGAFGASIQMHFGGIWTTSFPKKNKVLGEKKNFHYKLELNFFCFYIHVAWFWKKHQEPGLFTGLWLVLFPITAGGWTGWLPHPQILDLQFQLIMVRDRACFLPTHHNDVLFTLSRLDCRIWFNIKLTHGT